VFFCLRPDRHQRRARTNGLTLFESLEPRRVLDSTVVFNEIMYNPAGGDQSLEWIELHNQMSVDMNLSGWSLQEAVEYTFPQGTILGGGQYLVVAASPTALQAAQGFAGAFGPFQRQLGDGGDRIELRNHTGRLMDAVEYGDDGDWPAAADGSGASLAKIRPQSGSEPPSNWTFSSDVGGTPGGANSTSQMPLHDALQFSEVAAFNDGAFFVEIQNRSDQSVSLSGLRLANSQLPQRDYVFSGQSLAAGGYATVTAAQLGYQVQDGDRLLLFTADRGDLLDGVKVGDRLQARALEQDGRWQFPTLSTPGSVNQFDFHDQIVINEIMYHARPNYATPALYTTDTVLPIDAQWRFDQSGQDIGATWREPGFDDSTWSQGQGLFFMENAELPGPKNTPLTLGVVTYYFRTTFQWDNPTEDLLLDLRHVVDDGAVFYLNGVEINRFNMPSGAISSSTVADSSVGNAGYVGPVSVPGHLLVQGSNTLAVEVHQNLAFSPDVVFGATLSIQRQLTSEVPFEESAEEWIELYNRSDQPVDLSGWSLRDAVDYTFPAGTSLAANQYLLVANDADELLARHPGIDVVGEFAGRLSDHDERIQLLDSSQNLADEVHYYEDGRWPSYADGGGSSLELRDPNADNSKGEAWASSDERSRSTWNRFSYTSTVTPIVLDPPINFHEFVMGLLGPGEVLIDNLSVIDGPGSANVQLIQNRTFEADVPGSHAEKWRLVGTHEFSEVIDDPDQPGNQVLRLVAEAHMSYLSNHAETTLADGARVTNGHTYEISFDAKWINGTPQLHTELYYKDAAKTTILPQPAASGTPGARNSTWQANLGPTYNGLRHAPLIPSSTDSVTVSVDVGDPDGLAGVQLFYAVDGVEPFTSLPMTAGADGRYRATIPPQANRDVVQFYVRAIDSQGAVSMFPAEGPRSRALYKVVDNLNLNPLRHDLRIVMIPAEARQLHTPTNMVDNNRWGATVVYDNDEVFYDVGARLKGSMFTRPSTSSTGYNLRFSSEQLFRGVHDTLRFDQNGESEILVKYFTAAIGNPGGSYDDVMQLTTPTGQGGGPTLTYLAGHDGVFLSEQFENGQEGTLFEFEGIRVMQATVDGDPESLKLYQPIGWVPQFDIQDLGGDKELYRWPFLIRNNRDRDDYGPIIAMAKTFSLQGDALKDAVAQILDVEQWMSTFAIMSLFGIGDAYSQGNPHNLNIYVHPETGKLLAFPWDWDFVFSQPFNAPLHGGSNIGKIIDLPAYEHVFLGQLHHMITTMFNRAGLDHWTQNFGQLLGGSLQSLLTNVEQRGNFVLGQLPPDTLFQIGTDPPNIDSQLLVNAARQAQVLIPTTGNGGDQLGTTWTQLGFVPSNNWQTGAAGVGFAPATSNLADEVTHDISSMSGVNATAYIRIPFQVSSDPSTIDRLKLRMKYDDGFAAYLNGQLIAAASIPDPLEWNSAATASHPNLDAERFVDFDVTAFLPQLRQGDNVLAIHGLNRLVTSNDFLMVPELVAETFPETTTKEATVNAASITLDGLGWVNVREIRIDGQTQPLDVEWTDTTTWQATIPLQPGENQLTLQAINYSGQVIGIDRIKVTSTIARPELDHLRVSELMYHAPDPDTGEVAAGFDDDDQFDFLELINTSTTTTLDLSGVHLEGGVQFAFPQMSLAPGQRAVVVDNLAAFRQRYGSQIDVAGQFQGSLNNGGEDIALHDAGGTPILQLSYADSDPWPLRADGSGASLELIDVLTTPVNEYARPVRWRASTDFGGSPGSAGSPAIGVVINEVLANTDAPLVDSIELYNSSGRTVDLSGWYVSDSGSRLRKYALPQGTELMPGEFLVLSEADFNPTPQNPGPDDFALNGSQGDEVYLVVPGVGQSVAMFVDEAHFGASASGESFGRAPDGTGRLAPQLQRSLGAPNVGARIGPVVISEIQYAPADPSNQALAMDPTITRDDLEYVELHNVSTEAIELNGWNFSGAIEFRFGAAATLQPGASLVIVPFQPGAPQNSARVAAFRAHYGLADTVPLLGGYAGQLSDDGELVQFLRPDPSATGQLDARPQLWADEVLYDRRPPWPAQAANTGQSLNRIPASAYGNLPGSWQAAEPSPGTVAVPDADFNSDGKLDALDVELLHAAIISNDPQFDPRFDLNDDSLLNRDDQDFMVQQVLGSTLGDVNLDRVFNSGDLVLLFQVGEYEDGIAGNSTWIEGDWDCDGDFTTGDLVAAFQLGSYTTAAIGSPNARLAAAILAGHDRFFQLLGRKP
jgi:hypothetical protein